jgi:hypothetical protein
MLDWMKGNEPEAAGESIYYKTKSKILINCRYLKSA